MDFTLPVTVRPADRNWVTSPADGVSRVHLEREAAESGHTTSLVRFAPGSSFPPHVHPMGEEFLVLEGTFSDETGDFPEGTYVRNPPGSSHSPFTRNGCALFVKLEQFQSGDDTRIVIRPEDRQWQPGIGGLKVLPLHEFATEHSALVYWPTEERFQPHRHWGGEEILVLSGEFVDEHGRYPAGSWVRNPHLSQHTPRVEDHETLIFVKVGHLQQQAATA